MALYTDGLSSYFFWAYSDKCWKTKHSFTTGTFSKWQFHWSSLKNSLGRTTDLGVVTIYPGDYDNIMRPYTQNNLCIYGQHHFTTITFLKLSAWHSLTRCINITKWNSAWCVHDTIASTNIEFMFITKV